MSKCKTESQAINPLAPDTLPINIGCVPTSNNDPVDPPASDEVPFHYNANTDILWFYDCGTETWHDINYSLCALEPTDIDVINNVCDTLKIPVTYDINGQCVEGTTTLSELSDKILECVVIDTNVCSMTPATAIDLAESDIQLAACANGENVRVPMPRVVAGTNVAVSHNTNTNTYTVSAITDQATARLVGTDLIITNDDGSSSTVSLSSLTPNIDYDQATARLVGTDLIVTNEDGSSSTVDLSSLIPSLNTDQASIALVTDTTTGDLSGEVDIILTNEDGSTSNVEFLSNDMGQLLELRPDGLYYGLEVERNEIFIDSELGYDNDTQADGTRARPYLTFSYGANKLPSNKTGTIYLHAERNTPYLVEEPLLVTNGAKRTITHYGSTYESLPDSYNGFETVLRYLRDLQRPKLQFGYFDYPDVNRSDIYPIKVDNGGKLFLLGLEIMGQPYNIPTKTIRNDYGIIAISQVRVDGCVVDNTYTGAGAFSIIGYFPAEPVTAKITNSLITDITATGSVVVENPISITVIDANIVPDSTAGLPALAINTEPFLINSHQSQTVLGLIFTLNGAPVSFTSNQVILP